jgi:hypothetical protein
MYCLFEANGLGIFVVHFPAAFPKLFLTKKGFSLTSGLACHGIAKKFVSLTQPFYG